MSVERKTSDRSLESGDSSDVEHAMIRVDGFNYLESATRGLHHHKRRGYGGLGESAKGDGMGAADDPGGRGVSGHVS